MSWRKSRVLTIGSLIAVILTTLTIAGTEKTSSSVTARSLSRAIEVAAGATGTPLSARQLQDIDLGTRPDAPITEAGAVALLKSLGIGASTTNPGRIVTRPRADALMVLVRAGLVPVHHRGAGSGSIQELPAGVDTCFQERNHGACMDCCKNLGGNASTCAKACMVINKPSPEEPLP